MRLATVFLALAASIGAAEALSGHSVSPHHVGLVPRYMKKRSTMKCRKVSKTSSSAKATSTSTSKTTTSNDSGTVNVGSSGNCGSPNAQSSPSKTSGPNGAESWLNCGVDSSSGWNPPTITNSEVVSKNLADVIDNSVFSPCKQYLSYFNQWGAKYNIPPIMLASFALQESSCNAYPSGGDGHGLMQITTDKCGDAPNGNCEDPSFNIMSGARYFASVVSSHNGNLVQSVGEYNGWNKGMTVAQAKEQPGGCVTQRNLDYLHQFFNGWMQGVDASNMGTYFNLANC